MCCNRVGSANALQKERPHCGAQKFGGEVVGSVLQLVTRGHANLGANDLLWYNKSREDLPDKCKLLVPKFQELFKT